MPSKAVVVLKTKTDLDSIDNTISQWDQIISECNKRGVLIVGRLLTTAGFSDVIKKIRKFDKTTAFQLVVVYSPHQYTDKKQSYLDFVEEVKETFQANVVCIRN